ncbi:unnamed protein product [Pedinophyceae sp. YPF-701]|nr:unnamed protein product [Pedinophyceae sp. YPF-701]
MRRGVRRRPRQVPERRSRRPHQKDASGREQLGRVGVEQQRRRVRGGRVRLLLLRSEADLVLDAGPEHGRDRVEEEDVEQEARDLRTQGAGAVGRRECDAAKGVRAGREVALERPVRFESSCFDPARERSQSAELVGVPRRS